MRISRHALDMALDGICASEWSEGLLSHKKGLTGFFTKRYRNREDHSKRRPTATWFVNTIRIRICAILNVKKDRGRERYIREAAARRGKLDN